LANAAAHLCRKGEERNDVRKRTKLSALLATTTLLGGFALSAVAAMPAQADYAPGPNDIVGVGSDTLQYIVDFGNDGDTSGDLGYNDGGNPYKAVSMDATADANARAAYQNGSTNANLLPLSPSVVLRGGTSPVQRPNGSGAGIAALGADTSAADPTINFVRMSSAPTATQGSAVTGGVEVVQIATEPLEMAVDTASTNAPAGLSLQQLLAIYTCSVPAANGANANTWHALDAADSSTDTINPEIPQSGSGTRSTFLAQLATVNGGNTVNPGSCVTTVEENDPTSITSGKDGTPADSIVPFSSSRLNLWNSGYFHDPTVAYPSATALTPGIKLLSGTPSDGNAVWDDVRPLFIVYPFSESLQGQSGQPAVTPWQPGSKINWAQTLFCNPNYGNNPGHPIVAGTPEPFFEGPGGQAAIAAAGATPSFNCAATTLG
jgi:ABC-type phosphate transport system substrate-binding protein